MSKKLHDDIEVTETKEERVWVWLAGPLLLLAVLLMGYVRSLLGV
jgi:hypothetical protein